MFARGSLTLSFAFALFACGNSNSSGVPDAEVADAAPFMLCGNFLTEGDEGCDDGNEDSGDGCSPTCQFECGDGAVTGAELCDPAIAAGTAGACPTEAECSDDDPCTTGVVSGAGCEVTCEFATTTGPAEGDSCCPVGADATTDGDCTAECGNSVVEPPELCDTTIPSGNAGACPAACDDGQDCTTNTLTAGSTCAAACSYPAITAIGPTDGCCPSGANPNTDGDCSKSCGDGAVTGIEVCDTAIATGPGSCPTACDDGNACTTDALVNAGTCRAACTTTPKAPGPMDSCCPQGADLGDDPDCPPACGDGVITPPETCDDNDDAGGDGCSAICRIEPIGFRFRDMDLKDPHTFATVPILGCTDVTNLDLFGNKGVNPTLQISLQTDDDGDGDLDLSIANTFVPLVQTVGSTSASDLVFPSCTSPLASPTCTLAAGAAHTTATATNMGGAAVCLGPVPGTLGNYSPPLASPTAPPKGGTCYVGNAGTATFSLGGIPITLIDARIGGEWYNTPATEIRDGMIRGFLTQESANTTIIPEGTTGIATIDGEPLASLLRGGTGNCSVVGSLTGDKDTYTPPGGTATTGWYFYLNFVAARVSYTEL